MKASGAEGPAARPSRARRVSKHHSGTWTAHNSGGTRTDVAACRPTDCCRLQLALSETACVFHNLGAHAKTFWVVEGIQRSLRLLWLLETPSMREPGLLR